MPVRNGASFLEEAIESVLKQTYADFEFIIIDDGSTDQTPGILFTLASKDIRIRLLRTAGEGIVSALNLGIRAARGELIARMDGDDIALPNRLAVQTEILRDSPRLVALGSGATVIDVEGTETGEMIVPADATDAMTELLRRNSFLHPTMILRRSAVIAAGLYRPACIYAEDYDLWLRLSESGEMANVPRSLMKLRTHSHQTSKVRRFTQRAATALARQLAVRRRNGHEEGIDMSLNLHAALHIFLTQREHSGEAITCSELRDIEVILREMHNKGDTTLEKRLIRLLQPAQSWLDRLMLRLKLALSRPQASTQI